ncbi:MAG: metalloregulator ArsR/SmtB family transcription factor [Planctomycetes bacterium]|jgi:ArsR family transcriptional regulator|nr:metalloregulator ArsR/SmtB family transcription factor [Planctomycetota bacterium]
MIDSTKALVFERQAEIAKAVAHPLRVAAIDFLKDGEKCVCEIAAYLGSERSNVSRHLSLMVGAGVLRCRKEGLKVFYKLRTPCVADFLSCVTRILKQQAQENEKLLASL